MIYCGKTDKGLIRDNNQDVFGIYDIAENVVLFVVCDGMGGEVGGEIASNKAIVAYSDKLKECYLNLAKGKENNNFTDKEIKGIMKTAVEFSNNTLREYIRENPEYNGMGTTLVSLLSFDSGRTVYMLNVGDSRFYQITNKDLFQISKDHSYVQYLVDKGDLTPEEAKTSPYKNKITRAVGVFDDIDPDITAVDTDDADLADTYFLLCSDGLTNMLEDTDIYEIVSSELKLEDKVECLIRNANDNGGIDNSTVILINLK